MEFIFQYPIWFIVFCFLLGLVYSSVLYFKTDAFADNTPIFHWVKKVMALFRFLSVSVLSFLLLSPLIKSRFVDKVQPSIVIVHDNSSSIKLSFGKLDSSKYLASLNEMYKAFDEKYLLDLYTFSDKAYQKDTLTFLEKRTNISNTLEQINSNYFNRNVGAVILATDGIYNEGNNPIYTDFNFPIYTIALGDTSSQKDLKIAQVNANKIAYLDDEVQVDVIIEAINSKNENVFVELLNNKGKRISSKKINLKEDYIEQKVAFVIKATNVGIQKYSIKISEIEGEISLENNISTFYIDVIDSRQKVLILANAPHPDIAALKQSVSKNKNLEVDVQYINRFGKNSEEYNLIVLHNLPSIKNNAQNIFSQITKEKIPFLFIAASATNFNSLNKFQSIINIKPSAKNLNEATAFFNQNFTSFNLTQETSNKLNKFPPVSVPFGSYKFAATAKPLLYQKIGAIETDYPIILLNENLGVKSGIIIGEGIWRWRLHDYLENKNHDAFDELFQKTINYLAIKSDKRKFRVSNTKNVFFETEPVIIEAELYNESYELVNEPEIKLQAKNEKGEEFPLSMSRINNAYVLKTTSLPIGAYTYTATTTYAAKNYKASGAFSIKTLQLEAIQTKANHKILHQIAEKTNGAVFYPNNLNKLKEFILNKEDIKPTLFESFKTRSIINLKWIFFFIVALLSIEWFARKYYGAY